MLSLCDLLKSNLDAQIQLYEYSYVDNNGNKN